MGQAKKLIFLDIDETLIHKGRDMTDGVRHALTTAQNNGHFLCICTGRSYCEIPKELRHFDGIISSAGACIMWHGETLFEKYLTQNQVLQITPVLEAK